MASPVNLFFTAQGQTALRYWTQSGERRERVVSHPAALLLESPDPEADVAPGELETPEAVLFAAFRALPLCPNGAWRLKAGAFSPLWERTFAGLLAMLRKPPAERWCVRGEPGWFLQFGLRLEGTPSYAMGAFVLPCGKPAVLTFRAEDLIERLPPRKPFARMSVVSEADGLEARRDEGMGWDTRIRLPLADRGAAWITLEPEEI